MTEEQTTTETNRDRVRRLFINPMIELGFRFPHRTPEDTVRKRLDRMADDLGYLTDENLRRVQVSMRDKGEGSARCFWPPRATIIAYAQVAQPRPIEDLPELAGWFGSVAGRAALTEGRLVAEYRFWLPKHRPPLSDQEKRRVAELARQDEERVMRIRDRATRMAIDADDQSFLGAYEADHAAALRLVEAGSGRDAA
jgi:hypothetical protein